MTDSDLDVLVVGIDAACASVLDPLIEADAVPTLASLFEEGTVGPLESQIPPWTPSAWPSMYTGTNPGKHGVFSFLRYDGYDWDLVDAGDLSEPTLWELADYHGCSSVVVNAPVTHPPPEIAGAVIPGYMAPADPTCHPEGLLAEVRDAIGGYRLYGDPADDSHAALREAYTDLVRMRGEAFRYLAGRVDPSLGFLQFQATDTVFHEAPGDRELVRAVYEAVDEQLAATLEAHEPGAIFVVSDHGMGKYDGSSFRVNEYLAEHGFVETTRDDQGMPSWLPIRERRLRAEGTASDGSTWRRRAVAAAARMGLTTDRLGTVLSAVGLKDAVAQRVPADIVRAGTRRVDFRRSRAYMRTRIETGIRINLEGREPAGVVAPAEYESVRDELISLLSTVETPAGEPVFEDVAPREQFFEGPAADQAVDIVTVPTAFDHFLSADLLGDVFDEPGQPWNHKREGLFAATGSRLDACPPIRGAHLFDIAPTVLAALDIPAATRMDGRTLPVVEPAGRRTYPDYEPVDTDTTPGEQVESHLADLGYIDT